MSLVRTSLEGERIALTALDDVETELEVLRTQADHVHRSGRDDSYLSTSEDESLFLLETSIRDTHRVLYSIVHFSDSEEDV